MDEVKQVIVLRKDLSMRKGKCVAQGAHASLCAFQMAEKFSPEDVKKWNGSGNTKICVSVDSEQELLDIHMLAISLELNVVLIRDAGRTEFKEPTFTAVGIGPAPSSKIDLVTGKLKLL